MIYFCSVQDRLRTTGEPLANMATSSIDKWLPDAPAPPHSDQPQLRAIITKHLIIDACEGNTLWNHKVIKNYAHTCKTATKEISLILNQCKDKLHQCRKLYYKAAMQKHYIGSQYIKEECENEALQEQILHLKQHIWDVQTRWARIAELKKQWEHKHWLNRILTQTVWVNMEFAKAAEVAKRAQTTGAQDDQIAFNRQWATVTVMKKMILRELNDGLEWIGAEDKATVIELNTVVQAML